MLHMRVVVNVLMVWVLGFGFWMPQNLEVRGACEGLAALIGCCYMGFFF